MINDGVEIFDDGDRRAMIRLYDVLRSISHSLDTLAQMVVSEAKSGKGGCVRIELDTAFELVMAAISDGFNPALNRLECALNEPNVVAE